MKTSTILKWITGAFEAILGIPFIGGVIVVSFAWTPLVLLLLLHIVSLVFSIKEDESKTGNILGIVTNCIAWIPFVGMVMHIITAIVVLIDAYRSQARQQSSNVM
ncbi:hypothetical protein [Bacillus sp. 2205SS5-2]|uniref:hypothetical protein n=1 Tax=Bacillus sp. 2205SS5-2 TaxID=3109031 RepID=UPI0030057934